MDKIVQRQWTATIAAVSAACLVMASGTYGGIEHDLESATRRSAVASELELIERPFVPAGARRNVQERVGRKLARREQKLRDLLPKPILDTDDGQMGWSLPDRDYWAQMPPAVRHIPRDWHRLPTVQFTSAEVGGRREIVLARGAEYDQWLLHDQAHGIWASLAVGRATRHVYFMEITPSSSGWQYKPAFDNCYRCHPSGPRAIRPLDEAGVDLHTLASFNRTLLSYGACDFGDTVNKQSRGEPLQDTRCNGCHDGVLRGRLYGIHTDTATYKAEVERTMPP